jgi:Domain of unknown function (DUF1918)
MAERKQSETTGRAGDWVEVHGPSGKRSRRGQITEVLGAAGREHYRVRWDEQHESIFYPAAGVVILQRKARSTQARQRSASGRSRTASGRARSAPGRPR